MTARSFKRLRLRLVVLVVLALAPAMALILAMSYLLYWQAVADIRNETMRHVQVAALEQERLLTETHRLLAALARADELRQAEGNRCGAFLAASLKQHPRYLNFGVARADGSVACSALPVPPNVNLADRPYVQRTLASGSFSFGGYQVGRISRKASVNFGYPLLDGAGVVRAVLFAAFDLAQLGHLYDGTRLPENSVMVILDSDGTVLARFPDGQRYVGKQFPDSAVVHRMRELGGSGFAETVGIDGIERMFGFERLGHAQSGQVSVAFGIPRTAVSRAVRDTIVGLLAAWVAVSGLVLWAAWVFGDWLVARPVNRLLDATQRLGAGDFGARTGLPLDGSEIGELASAFDRMAEQLQTRQREIANQKAALDEHAIVSIADLSGRIVYANDRFAQISQYAREELLGQDHRLLNSGYHSKAFFVDMWRTIASGRVWHGTICNRRKDGSHYWVTTTIVPFVNESGRPYQYVSVRTDVTDIKEALEQVAGARAKLEKRVAQRTAELTMAKAQLEADVAERRRAEAELQENYAALQESNRKLQETRSQLLQSEKMASIGQLAAGVAHEINNPIGYVYSNLGSLEKYLRQVFAVAEAYEAAEGALEAAVRERIAALKQKADFGFVRDDIFALMSESREGITRVKKIVENLKNFSHMGSEEEWQWADMRKGLDSTLNIVWNELKYKAEVKKEYTEIPEIECLPSQLNQVFLNVLVNAAQAIEEHGVITLRTGAADDQVWVEIADTGRGIAPEHLKHIFDPFFTTKETLKNLLFSSSEWRGRTLSTHGHEETEDETEFAVDDGLF